MNRVLLAEKSNILQHLLEQYLISAGYAVRSAANPGELENYLNYDENNLLILDLGFLNFQETESVKRIHTMHPGVKILLIYKSLTIEETIAMMRAGAWDMVAKPVEESVFLEKVRKAFSEEEAGKKHSISQPDVVETLYGYSLLQQFSRDKYSSILLMGDPGTDFFRYAKQIHEESERKSLPFVTVECAAIDPLSVREYFLGAVIETPDGRILHNRGILEEAEGGTLLLSHIDQLPIRFQQELSNIIYFAKYNSVHDRTEKYFNVRLISTIAANPEELLESGTICKDLFYAISAVRFHIPPLGERTDIMEALVHQVVSDFSKSFGKPMPEIRKDYIDKLRAMEFPGNDYELYGVICRSMSLVEKNELTVESLRFANENVIRKSGRLDFQKNNYPLREYLHKEEQGLILEALDHFDGDKKKTAEWLGISERNLRYKLEKS